MAKERKRFSISLDPTDDDALRELGEAQRPPMTKQYLVERAVKSFLDQHTGRQLSIPLDRL
jgi:predicted transcriptional regulator